MANMKQSIALESWFRDAGTTAPTAPVRELQEFLRECPPEGWNSALYALWCGIILGRAMHIIMEDGSLEAEGVDPRKAPFNGPGSIVEWDSPDAARGE